MSAADITAADVVRSLDHIAAVVDALETVRERKAELAADERGLVETIKAALGEEGTVGTIEGRPVVTFRWSKPGMIIDGRALRADHPELYEKYLVEKQASRPFKQVES